MPRKKRPKPLYQRGDYKLYRRPDRPNLEIIWYDHAAKRERSSSAGTSDYEAACQELDRRFLETNGTRFCPTCGQEVTGGHVPQVADAIADYLLLSEGKAGFASARGRLGHVVDYLAETNPTLTVSQITDAWANRFRKWMLERPVRSSKGKILRPRSVGHVEGCLMQLAAVVNGIPNQRAAFTVSSLKEASSTPTYRADLDTLAAMFRFALEHEDRHTLRAYLRAAVATWGRPDALLELVPAQQYSSEAGVVDLNPPGRRQTKKYRPVLPVARQWKPYLEAAGPLLPVVTLRHAWDPMRRKLELPSGGQAGPKLIRRSMATLARKRLGEAQWAQGEMFLGHRRASTSDIYALPDPANLGLALEVTEQIIDEIEVLCPGAYRNLTAETPLLSVVKGGKNG